MKIKTAALLFPAIFILASCAARVSPTLSLPPAKAAEMAKANTPELCEYKGKVSVRASADGESASFNALMDKNCSGEVSITFLGVLNSVVARMSYSKGELEVESSNLNIKRYLQIMGTVYAAAAEKYIRSPLIIPDGSFGFSAENGSYVFTGDGGLKIYADEDFRLYRYFDGNSDLSYKWDGVSISVADLSDRDIRIIIRFLNGAGWKGREER